MMPLAARIVKRGGTCTGAQVWIGTLLDEQGHQGLEAFVCGNVERREALAGHGVKSGAAVNEKLCYCGGIARGGGVERDEAPDTAGVHVSAVIDEKRDRITVPVIGGGMERQEALRRATIQ